jgi:uncharacterized metal-binding protein YceD (DUF177 family)
MTQQPAWSVKIPVEEIPETGAHFHLVADETTRAHLAQIAELRALPRLEASFDVTRQGPSRLQVTGEVSATLGQTCVVTLEPLERELSEGIDLAFSSDAAAELAEEEAEATIEFDQDEPVEMIVGGAIDLGAIATEFFLLGIDPYPRKEGAVFEPTTAGDPAAKPFAALAALKKGGNGTGT